MTSDKVKKRGFVCFFNCFVNISFTSLCDLLCLFVFLPLYHLLLFFSLVCPCGLALSHK